MIIQGVIHAAPRKVYALLSKDMDEKIRNGFVVFYEGIDSSEELREGASKREKDIYDLLNLLFELTPAAAEGLRLSEQNDDLEYPENAINADIAIGEAVKELYKRKFKCHLIVQILKIALNEENGGRERLVEKFSKERPVGILKFTATKIYRLFVWITLDLPAFPVLVDFRNKRAIDIIESSRKEIKFKDSILYYGSGHIPGMAKILEKNGWTPVSSQRIKLV